MGAPTKSSPVVSGAPGAAGALAGPPPVKPLVPWGGTKVRIEERKVRLHNRPHYLVGY